MRESTPTKHRPSLSKFYFSITTLNLYPFGNLLLGRCNFANPRTLSPRLPNPLLTFMNFYFHYSVMGTG